MPTFKSPALIFFYHEKRLLPQSDYDHLSCPLCNCGSISIEVLDGLEILAVCKNCHHIIFAIVYTGDTSIIP